MKIMLRKIKKKEILFMGQSNNIELEVNQGKLMFKEISNVLVEKITLLILIYKHI